MQVRVLGDVVLEEVHGAGRKAREEEPFDVAEGGGFAGGGVEEEG